MRKHQTWLWVVIIGFTIVSFVIFFSPNARTDFLGGGRNYDFGSINGKPITREDYLKAAAEMRIFFFLRTGEWLTEENARMAGVDMNREIYNRLAVIEKLNDMKVKVSDDAVTAFLASPQFLGDGRGVAMDKYQKFITELRKVGYSEADFERFVQHQIGQQHLVELYGLGGKLLPPQEAEYLYKRDHETMSVEAVFFSATNFLSQVKADEQSVSNYFQSKIDQYHIPDQRVVDYVKFDVANYTGSDEQLLTKLKEMNPSAARMTNLSEIVDTIYRERGPNAFKDKNERVLSMDEAKKKIKEDMHRSLALQKAHKDATDFGNALEAYLSTNTTDRAAFEKVAAERKLKVMTSAPFDQRDLSEQAKLPGPVRYQAFRLDKEETPISGAVEAEDGFYVMQLKQTIPGRNPEFKEVRDKVTEDYKTTEAAKLARKAGEKFAEALAKALDDGRTFESACAGEKVKPVSLPPFSLSTRSLPELKGRVSVDRLQNAVGRLAEHKSTDFMYSEDGGLVLYLKNRTPVSEQQLKRELPEFTRSISEQRQYAAYSQWASQLQQEMRLVVPQQQTRPAKKQPAS